MIDSNINHLCPALQRIVPQFVQKCADVGITVRILTTYRDAAEQNAAAASGKSRATAGQSPHNCTDAQGASYSKAFDFGVIRSGKYVSDGSDAAYAVCGGIGKGFGLEWGGDFKSIFDPSHMQLSDWRNNPGL